MTIEYRDSAESRAANITYHLAEVEEWETQKHGESYTPGAFEADGFIHCTNGLDLLTKVANMFYQNSPEPRTVLVLDMSKISSEVRYDDPDENFPHIYGELNPTAVIGELAVQRAGDGTFTQLGSQRLDNS